MALPDSRTASRSIHSMLPACCRMSSNSTAFCTMLRRRMSAIWSVLLKNHVPIQRSRSKYFQSCGECVWFILSGAAGGQKADLAVLSAEREQVLNPSYGLWYKDFPLPADIHIDEIFWVHVKEVFSAEILSLCR